MSEFSTILPNNQDVLNRDEKWKKLFEKYENCGDCEEDGYDIRDLIACSEVEDEELDDLFANEEEATESNDEECIDNKKDLVVFNSKPKTLQDLEIIYEPEFIKGLKRAFNKRCTELDGMNLTFWKRAKTHEGFNESNIKTPNFEASTRSFFHSSEQVCQSNKKPQQRSPNTFKMPHPVNLNFGNFRNNLDQTNNFETSQRFPLQINDLMNGSQKINIRIREMHYDLSVDGRDITEFFMPNCNSTYQNAIPALGNLTINNTVPNFDSFQKQDVLQPAIKHKVGQIRKEPTEKLIEKPDLNKSNVEQPNSSLIKVSDSSREESTSKGKKPNAHKRRYRKKYKPKQIDSKSEDKIKEIPLLDTIVSNSEKLELSYSDVVKLSPKNNLKQTKTSKPVNDSKNQLDQPQKSKKSSQKKNCNEIGKKYLRIIDRDTSSEELFEKQELSNEAESTSKIQQNIKVKDSKKLKDTPEISSKSEVPKKFSKSMDKINKKEDEIGKYKQPKNKLEVQKAQPKLKSSVKVNENKIEQPQTPSSLPTKKLSNDKKENKPKLQYDDSGAAFQNIGGLIVRYEDKNDDSDSSEDDTEFFRRIHAEIRQKKVLSNKNC